MQNDKIQGCIFGGAIGDALGYPIEFTKSKEIRSKKDLTRYEDDEGIFSDDTQMTLFTIMGLLNWKKKCLLLPTSVAKCVYQAYLDWYDTQMSYVVKPRVSWIATISDLQVNRAPGNTCLGALGSGKMGTLNRPLNDSKGCGSVMRVAPIGLFYDPDKTNLHKIGMIGAQTGVITHGHPLGYIPCYILSIIISLLAHTNKDLYEAIYESLDLLNHAKEFSRKDKNICTDIISKAQKLALNNDDDEDNINLLGEGWVAEEALAIAIYSVLKYPNDFQKAIVCAINHKGDSDSTGAIAGNIIGTMVGYSAIPEYYKENIQLKDLLLKVSNDLGE